MGTTCRVLQFQMVPMPGYPYTEVFLFHPEHDRGGFDYSHSFLACFKAEFPDSGHGMSLAIMFQGITASFLIRVPLSYLFSLKEGASLFDIGLAVPAASVYGIIFFTVCYVRHLRKNGRYRA